MGGWRVKKAPSGLGFWIAFPRLIGDVSTIVAALLDVGASWVAPRYGVGKDRDKSWSPAHTKACLDAGLDVYPWVFSYPWQIPGEVALAKAAIAEGATGWIVDAEAPWSTGTGGSAIVYGDQLRAALGDTWIADAPWSHISWHPDYPVREFARWVDARLPQAYWTEHGQRLAVTLSNTKAQWAALLAAGMTERPVWPIGVTYGQAELIAREAEPCPGELAEGDVARFLGCAPGPLSLYTLEMLLTDTPNAKAALEALKARARGTPREPYEPLGIDPFESFFSHDTYLACVSRNWLLA